MGKHKNMSPETSGSIANQQISDGRNTSSETDKPHTNENYLPQSKKPKNTQSFYKNGLAFRNNASTIMILILSYAIIYTLLATTITPKKFDLKAGDIAPETITATKDIEDVITTEYDMQRAMNEIRPITEEDPQADDDMYKSFTEDFQLLRTARDLIRDQRVQMEIQNIDRETLKYTLLTEEVLIKVNQMLAIFGMTEKQIEMLMLCSDEDWRRLEDTATKALLTAQASGIKEGFEAGTIGAVESEIHTNLYSQHVDLRSIGVMVISKCLKPNTFVNVEKTQLAREEAKAAVTPTVYRKGQNIVKAGDIITPAQYDVINNLGLLNTDVLDIFPYIGIAVVLLLLMLLVVIFCYAFMPVVVNDVKLQTLLSIIIIIVMLSAIGVERLNVFLVPVTLGVLLMTVLLNYKLAIAINAALAILVSFVGTRDNTILSASTFNSAIACIISGSVGTFVIRRKQYRSQVLLSGLFMGICNLFTMLALGLISTANTLDVMYSAFWSGGGGLLAAMLCIGIQPILETIFQVATPSKLIELSNPNQPLLRRLLVETPGTYHHSIVVANLAESAAEAVGANALLARVGAYYHDIGKLNRPLFFKENQLGDNPHDRTDALVSTSIITSHTIDGAKLGVHEKLPKPIIDIIMQHHGNTPVQYFYAKACEEAKTAPDGVESVKIKDFRYSGPKPQTNEAAIVMLSDTVEAAARAMNEPTPRKISLLIKKLIKNKLDDGQLDESQLRIRDLNKIHAAFVQSLNGVFHERIEYPEVNITGSDEEGEEYDFSTANERTQTGWPAQQMGISQSPQKPVATNRALDTSESE